MTEHAFVEVAQLELVANITGYPQIRLADERRRCRRGLATPELALAAELALSSEKGVYGDRDAASLVYEGFADGGSVGGPDVSGSPCA